MKSASTLDPLQPLPHRKRYGHKVSPLTLPHDESLRRFLHLIQPRPGSWERESGDVCRWEGVRCGGERTPLHLVTSGLALTGNFTWGFMPSSLRRLFSLRLDPLIGQGIGGGLQFQELSLGLEMMDVKHNGFTSSREEGLDFTTLPRNVTHLDLSYNGFWGKCDLTALPQNMVWLDIGGNRFYGGVDLSSLPMSLEYLFASDNELSGTLDLSRLPSVLEAVNFKRNHLEGSVELARLPPSVVHLQLSFNRFSGVVDLREMANRSDEEFTLDLRRNRFSGYIYKNDTLPPQNWIEHTVPCLTFKEMFKLRKDDCTVAD